MKVHCQGQPEDWHSYSLIYQNPTSIVFLWEKYHLVMSKNVNNSFLPPTPTAAPDAMFCDPGPFAECHRANLAGADLSFADLREADLRSANVYGANLRGALLDYASLTDAELSYADLRGASVLGANLHMADLSLTNLNLVDLYGANANAETKWPEGFDPVGAGAALGAYVSHILHHGNEEWVTLSSGGLTAVLAARVESFKYSE